MNKNKLNLEILKSEIDNVDHNSGYNLIFVNDLMLNAELVCTLMKKIFNNH